MYHPDVTNNYLSQLTPSVIINEGKKNEKELLFELTYHSNKEVDEMSAHLNSLIDLDLYNSTKETSNVKISLKRSLNEDELIWIENERIICKWDCNYFQDHYYKILDEKGQWKQFSPLVPQRVNRRIRARLQKARRAINKWTVKARQQGETTDSQGVELHRINYFPDVKSLISSKDSDSTAKMADMFIGAMNKLPWWNRTHYKRFNTGEEYEFDNGSLLDLGWGTQTSIGRGRTPVIAHCSEIPFYKDPKKALEEALFNAMHESEWMMFLGEGTAEVRGDYYHLKTKEIIEGMEAGTTSFVFCFHPWCARRDLFPTETYMRARSDAFERWSPSTETLAHANKLRNWVLNNEDYREVFKEEWKTSDWHLDREQMFYYEIEKAAAIKKNMLHAFLKEKPSDPEEAFQNAGESLYPIQTIIKISDRAQKVTPDVYKLRGDPNEINPLLFPTEDERDFSKPLINIIAGWNTSLPKFHYQLLPIHFKGWDNFNPQNKILIWEHPQSGVTYGMSCDDSDGLGINQSDDAVFEIAKKGTVEYPDKQVCEFVSAELPPMNLRPFGLALATYYSPDEQLLLVPETNKSTEFLNGMQNVGWENIYRRSQTDRADKDFVISNLMGFKTNPANRRALVAHFNSFIIGDFVELYSMMLIQELKDLVKKRTPTPILGELNEKILAGRGKSDNRFMAFAILMYALHRDEIIGLEQAAWQQRVKTENSVVILKEWQGSELDKIDVDNPKNLLYLDEDEWDESVDNLLNLVGHQLQRYFQLCV